MKCLTFILSMLLDGDDQSNLLCIDCNRCSSSWISAQWNTFEQFLE